MARIHIIIFAVLVLSAASSTSAMAIELAQAASSPQRNVPPGNAGTAGSSGGTSSKRMKSSAKPNVPQSDAQTVKVENEKLQTPTKPPVIKKKKKKKKISRTANTPS